LIEMGNNSEVFRGSSSKLVGKRAALFNALYLS